MIEPSGLSFDYLLNEKPEGDFYAEKEYTAPEGFFRTPSGKIEIYSDALEQVGFNPLPSYLEPERGPVRGEKSFLEKYPLDSFRRQPEPLLHSQPASPGRGPSETFSRTLWPRSDLKRLRSTNIADGDPVVVETNRGRVKMKARVDERVAEGIVLVPHGWGGDANANLLTDVNCREPIMGYPDQKSLQCRISKASKIGGGEELTVIPVLDQVQRWRIRHPVNFLGIIFGSLSMEVEKLFGLKGKTAVVTGAAQGSGQRDRPGAC